MILLTIQQYLCILLYSIFPKKARDTPPHRQFSLKHNINLLAKKILNAVLENLHPLKKIDTPHYQQNQTEDDLENLVAMLFPQFCTPVITDKVGGKTD